MKIGIVGAGAIGIWVGTRLAKSGNDVRVLARGATLQAIQTHGLRLREAHQESAARVQTSADGVQLGVVDLLVIAVKGPSLAAAASAARPMIGSETMILPMLNGVPWWFLEGKGDIADPPLQSVDPDGSITANLPLPRVIGCVVHSSCVSPEPGLSVRTMGDKLIIGEPLGGESERLNRLAAVIRDAGLTTQVSAAIQQDVWYKLWGNMTMNPISAITGATCDRILDDPLVEGLVLAVMREAAELGARIGCPISASGAERILVTRRLGAFKTSMLQDVEANRPIELDLLLSAPREIAHRLSMPTPFMDALLGLCRLFGESRQIYTRKALNA